MTTAPIGHHQAKAYEKNELLSGKQLDRIKRKHPQAISQAREFNREKVSYESGILKPLQEDTYISESKKGIKGAAEKAGAAIKEGASKLGKFIGNHKVGAAIVGAVAVAGAAFGIYKGVQAHNNKAQAHQA